MPSAWSYFVRPSGPDAWCLPMVWSKEGGMSATRECVSCGSVAELPNEAVNQHAITVCVDCGWVDVWEKEVFRPLTRLEMELVGQNPMLLLQVGSGALERQKRIMAGNNAS